jgi:hypothetical protein
MMNLRRPTLPRRTVVGMAIAWLAAAVAVVSLGFLAANRADEAEPAAKIKPAKVESVQGSAAKRVTLTSDAAKRLNVQTAQVLETEIAGKLRKVIPYAAVIYDRSGEAWAITNPGPLVYLRQKISIEYVDRDMAVLADGPAAGTAVVTVGAAEVYGTELGIG